MSTPAPSMLNIRTRGIVPYQPIWEEMKQFTQTRDQHTPDELWLLEHEPVYTQGQAGKAEHILNAGNIPVIQTDRGGQVTYHGPGQLVVYVLMDIGRRQLGIKSLITQLEQSLVDVLQQYDITAETDPLARGVFVQGKKIASIGLRVKNGCTYHGLALNVSMDLTPFHGINPCGYVKLHMTQVADFVPRIQISDISPLFTAAYLTHFNR